MISIESLDKSAVLAALYNKAKVQGLGIFQALDGDMTLEEATELLNEQTYFDYCHGRVMKVDLSKEEFDPWLYDRDNGPGAAERIIGTLRDTVHAERATA